MTRSDIIPFKCDFCEKTYKTLIQKKKHVILVHTNTTTYKCRFCSKEFRTKGRQERHEIIHRGEKPFCCHLCEKTFSCQSSLRSHTRIHSGEKPYNCKYCQKNFKSLSARNSHEKIHLGQKNHKCKFCEKTFNLNGNKLRHELIHKGEKPFICRFCGKGFFDGYCMKSHVKNNHVRITKCKFCGKKILGDNQRLIQHERTHTGERLYKCKYCSKSFITSTNRAQHLRTHTGEKPYKCTFCKYSFSQQAQKIRHELLHTGEKPFKCQYCEKRFNRTDSHRDHEKRHAKRIEKIQSGQDKPFKCRFCDKTFEYQCNQFTHERLHTGEKPFKCRFCDKRFLLRPPQIKHENAMHKGISYKGTGGVSRQKQKTKPKVLDTGESERPFKCQFCENRFKTRAVHRIHEERHAKRLEKIESGQDKPFKCGFCDKKFEHQFIHVIHEHTHTGEKPFKCQYCDKTFNLKAVQIKHENMEHKGIIYKRTSSGKKRTKSSDSLKKTKTTKQNKFRTQTIAINHSKVHENTFKCSYCEENFISNSDLEIHQSIHSQENDFDNGKKRKKSSDSLKVKSTKQNKSKKLIRRNRENIPDNIFKCKFCEEKFISNSDLEIHQSKHSQENEIDNRNKRTKSPDLHKIKKQNKSKKLIGRYRANDNIFKCSCCNENFRSKLELKIHHSIHSQENEIDNHCEDKTKTNSDHYCLAASDKSTSPTLRLHKLADMILEDGSTVELFS